jgi:2-iminobutanoate/2-iminopropanoate deaminase
MSSPYTPVFAAGDWRCVSGQIGLTTEGLAEDFGGQLDDALANLAKLLEDHGLRRDQVAKTTVFLTDMGDYAELNERYVAFFGDHRPARSAVAVAALPLDALVEVEAWAYVGERP